MDSSGSTVVPHCANLINHKEVFEMILNTIYRPLLLHIDTHPFAKQNDNLHKKIHPHWLTAPPFYPPIISKTKVLW